MPILSYHYVGDAKGFDFALHSCKIGEFNRHLDLLKSNYCIVSLAEYIDLKKQNVDISKYVSLVFDDGPVVHYNNVFPELMKRKILASFFPIASVFEGKIPAPIKMHVVFSQIDSVKIAEDLEKFLSRKISRSRRLNHKTRLKDGILTANIKQVLSKSPIAEKENFVNSQFSKIIDDEKQFCRKFFMQPKQIKEMVAAGMNVGSHSYYHTALDSLNFYEQKNDISRSKKIIENITNEKIYSFSCPFGVYNKDTVKILHQLEFRSVVAYHAPKDDDFIISCLDYERFFQ